MWNTAVAAASAREITAVLAPMVTDYSNKLFSVVHWNWGLNQILTIRKII